MYELARFGLTVYMAMYTQKNKCMSWHVVGCMWVRRRIYHNGAPAPAVMDARHRHTHCTVLSCTELHKVGNLHRLCECVHFNGAQYALCLLQWRIVHLGLL